MIPVSKPIISKSALKYVSECIKTGWVSSQGPFVKKFEEEFAKYIGVKQAITTTNGTSALHLALASIGIKNGDEVIIPTLTMAATAFAVLYTGARPVLVDSEKETGNMDPYLIEAKITKKTKAIIVVHLYGQPVDMNSINKIAKKYKLYVVEDAAEALGAQYLGKKVGSLGDLGCFSFYANKMVTTGEGGMVVTNNVKLAERARVLKDMSYSKKRRFLHTEVGFNYRFSNLQAALGLAQLEIIDKAITQKIKIAQSYNLMLKDLKSITLPVQKNGIKNVYWMYTLIAKTLSLKVKLMKKLDLKGIQTREVFIPMHKQPALLKLGLFKDEKYPVADYLSRRGLYIPSGPDLSNAEIDQIVNVIKGVNE